MDAKILHNPTVSYEEFVAVDKACFPNEPVTSRDAFSEMMQGEFWGAVASHKLIGFSHITIGHMAHVRRLAVLHSYRRKHIGSRMLQAGIDLCRERAVQKVFLSVQTDNTAAVQMYERFGFLTVGHLYQFIAPLRRSGFSESGTTVPVEARQVTELADRTRATLPPEWNLLVEQHAPPRKRILVFVGPDSRARGICRLVPDMPGCMPFMLEEPSASMVSAVRSLAQYVSPKYEGLIMTFPDERIARVCRDLGFVLNYELARMERLVV